MVSGDHNKIYHTYRITSVHSKETIDVGASLMIAYIFPPTKVEGDVPNSWDDNIVRYHSITLGSTIMSK